MPMAPTIALVIAGVLSALGFTILGMHSRARYRGDKERAKRLLIWTFMVLVFTFGAMAAWITLGGMNTP